MKIDKYSAILGNAVGYPDMGSLTADRPLAALPFDGKYRLMDFQLSSLANAGIRSVYAICTGQNARSVFDHIRSGREWGLNTLLSHFFLSFHQTELGSEIADKDYYNQVLTYLKRSGSDQTVYMSCDILCNIDLKQVIHVHNATKNNMTVVFKRMPAGARSEANTILDIDETDKIVGLAKNDPSQETQAMGAELYIVNTPWLIEKMEEEAKKDNPKKLRYLLRDLMVSEQALGYEHTGYLSNINSIQSYYQANMDMLDPQKFYTLFYANQKIYTKVKNEEATYFAKESQITNSQFASGSVIEGYVDHSIVSRSCQVAPDAKIAHSIIFPKVSVGAGATVEYAIVDKSITIPAGVTIRGSQENPVVIAKGQEITGDIIQ